MRETIGNNRRAGRTVHFLQGGDTIVIDASLADDEGRESVADAVAQTAAKLEAEQVVVRADGVVDLVRIGSAHREAVEAAGIQQVVGEVDVTEAGRVAKAQSP